MSSYRVNHIQQLESEAIFVLREVAAQFDNPVMLFSGGKDSIVMAHLASKAFHPAKLPFPLLHVDTGHNFEETISYRDQFVEKIDARLVVAKVQDSIDKGRVVEEKASLPVVMHYKRSLCLMLLKRGIMMRLWEEVAETRRKQEPKKGSLVIGTVSVNGIPKISVLSCGIFLTEEKSTVSIFGFFLFPIGLKWMSGNTLGWKIFLFLGSIFLTTARS